MAEVEWEHVHDFRGKAEQYWLGRRLRPWLAPPAKETIRARVRAQAGEADERVSAGA